MYQLEHQMNRFQIEWKSRTLARLYFNGDVALRTFMRTYESCKRNIFDTFGAMERRLDNCLFRSMFAESVFAARKLVSSGHITVNGRTIRLPGFQLADRDVLQVKPEHADLQRERVQKAWPWTRLWAFIPAYLEVSHYSMSTVFLRKPEWFEMPSPYPIDVIRNTGAFFSQRGHRVHPEHFARKFKKYSESQPEMLMRPIFVPPSSSHK